MDNFLKVGQTVSKKRLDKKLGWTVSQRRMDGLCHKEGLKDCFTKMTDAWIVSPKRLNGLCHKED